MAAMSILVIQIPPRERLGARGNGDAGPSAPAASEFDYVFSIDGLTPAQSGRCASAALPKADLVCAVLADADVGWQRLNLPKAPAAKLRPALGGLLEEALLEDDPLVHLALAPRAAAGQPAWVAAVNAPWLQATLAALETGGRVVERVLPPTSPEDEPGGHFFLAGAADSTPSLALNLGQGPLCLRLDGNLARSLLPAEPGALRWSATPAAAAAAEQWLGAPVAVVSDAERGLQAARGRWNLRQFGLAPRHRGLQAARAGLRRFLSPEWRLVRAGVYALVLVQLVGLNAWAWTLQQRIAGREAEMTRLLKDSFPALRVVYDAPVQMERETSRLRAAAGRPGAD
ncbi:MAG: general secretion pathway protein GspL, partial [Burkholderiales bacterium]|nr:general secretion pathway protein GspL [Burkholderiales bacterium]